MELRKYLKPFFSRNLKELLDFFDSDEMNTEVPSEL